MPLYEAFAGLTDPRRAEGRRIRLDQLLALVVIANLCGHHGYRPVARFCHIYQDLLSQQFKLKHGVPSYVTFRTVLTQLPEQTLIDGFNTWADTFSSLSKGDWISGDGKALDSTLTHMQDAKQDFQLMGERGAIKMDLSCVIHVHRQRIEQGQVSQVDAYFMSDLVLSAAEFAQGIRGHCRAAVAGH